MRIRTGALASAALITTLVLVGCAEAQVPSSSGMPGMSHGSELPADVNAADVMFVQMMIPHHQEAIEMADEVLAKDGIAERVVALAEQIKAAQGPEIEQMKSWLAEWAQPEMPSNGDDMGGMSEDDMGALDAVDGEEAARLFLEQMITHHQGAVDMAETEKATGQNPDVLELAEAIISGQTAEIATMRSLLASV